MEDNKKIKVEVNDNAVSIVQLCSFTVLLLGAFNLVGKIIRRK